MKFFLDDQAKSLNQQWKITQDGCGIMVENEKKTVLEISEVKVRSGVNAIG